MHSRKPISSFSRRLPVGVEILARKRMWAVFPRTHPVAQSARAPLLCQERTEWAMAEFGGSVQLASRAATRDLNISSTSCTNNGTVIHECGLKRLPARF